MKENSLVPLNRLDDRTLLFVIEGFARGFTVRKIANALLEQFQIVVSENDLITGGVQYGDQIESVRDELYQRAMRSGLARKEERVLRLSEFADEWEGAAKSNPKAATIYLRTLKQISDEVDPLGITIRINPEDPWLQLLQQVQEAGSPSDQTENS